MEFLGPYIVLQTPDKPGYWCYLGKNKKDYVLEAKKAVYWMDHKMSQSFTS